MSQQSQPKQSDLVKVLERQNVISYKKKPKQGKQLLKSQNNNEDEDNISAQSLQSGVYSQDVSRLKGKMNPLPELGKEKKRFITKNLLTQQLRINNYQEKQVRQHDNLMLKQKNNFLSSENMKLKTKISTLEKQNLKLQKMLQQQPNKSKTPGVISFTKQRFRPSGQNLSTKILMKNLKKQLDDLKKQNISIKSSIKFTTISELQVQRDAIMQETNRLRMMVEQQQNKRISLKLNQQGMSNLQQKISSLQDKNTILMRQNNELKNKAKHFEQNQNKIGKNTQSQKNLNKMLYNARRLLKQKQNQVQQLRQQIKTAGSIQSIGLASEKSISNQQFGIQQNTNQRKPSVQRTNPVARNFQKRVVSKSAQKTNIKSGQKILSDVKCQNCKRLAVQVQMLRKKIAEYESQLQYANPLILPSDPIEKPQQQEVKSLTKFLEYRLKAHHLNYNEPQKYLLNSENINEEELKKQMSIEQLLQSIVTQPFVILNKRYIEIFIIQLYYTEDLKRGSSKIKIDKTKKMSKQSILQNYKKLLPSYELLTPAKQQQMYLQIAQLVTTYYQQIFAAMSNRKNGEGTISQKELISFFTEIELEKQYIDFIIIQIILESIDLEKLNYLAFFQIFYMPSEQIQQAQEGQNNKKIGVQSIVDKKKRFQVDHVVKQEDQQYQQSRSYMDGSRQKTTSKHGQSFNEQNNQLYEDNQQSPQKQEQNQEKEGDQQQYEQQYDEEREDKQGKKEKVGESKEEKKDKEMKGDESEKEKFNNNKKNDQLNNKKINGQLYNNKKQKDDRQEIKRKKNRKQQSYEQQFEQQNMNSQIEDDEQENIKQNKKHTGKQIKNGKSNVGSKQEKGKNKEKNKQIENSKATQKPKKMQKPKQLIQKPYQIEDIEDQYNQQFEN